MTFIVGQYLFGGGKGKVVRYSHSANPSSPQINSIYQPVSWWKFAKGLKPILLFGVKWTCLWPCMTPPTFPFQAPHRLLNNGHLGVQCSVPCMKTGVQMLASAITSYTPSSFFLPLETVILFPMWVCSCFQDSHMHPRALFLYQSSPLLFLFSYCQPLKQKGKQFGQEHWVYLAIIEESQFETCKLWRTIGKSRKQRRGACFYREREEFGGAVLNKSWLEESES